MMQRLAKDICITEITKATKDRIIFDDNLRALRVLRGKGFVAAG
jgi:hypothetical protein